jgi:splicing factor U2AF subunit
MQRRDARRDDDDRRPPRGDRDGFDRRDGRGGGRGGGGRERDEFAMQRGAAKADSPPPKKKEPTPDLTDVVPITERRRRLTQWDIKPPGYENVTAEQAKLSGMFPLPGAPRQQVMDPSRLQSLMNAPSGANSTALKPSNARQSKRLFVHNLPPNAADEDIINFFNLQLNGLNVIEGHDPCISCNIAKDRAFALIEFKAPSDATVALALDGITMEGQETSNGSANVATGGLSIRRPKDYISAPPDEDTEMATDGQISSTVPDTSNKVCVTNILTSLDDDQVKELLTAFGALKSFVLVKDRSTEESRVSRLCSSIYLCTLTVTRVLLSASTPTLLLRT